MPKPGRTESWCRVYTERIVERLEFILKAKTLGLKLNEIKEILLVHDRGQAPCELTRKFINSKIIEIEDKIAALTSLKSKLQEIVRSKTRKSLPASICPIITVSEKNS